MRKISSLLFITLTLLFIATSCSEKDDPIVEKGTLISASFSPTTKKFTLTFSKGSTETVDAIIDNTPTPPTASATLKDGTVISVDDATVKGEAVIGSLSAYQYVNDWIYEEMNIYYLWNDLIPKKPNFDLKPDKFFDSLLNKYNKITNPEGDRFSWIEENYVELLGSLSGVQSDEIGFEYIPFLIQTGSNEVYFLVTYPKLATDAYDKGINRGRFITAVDDKVITTNNYRNIFSGTGSKTLSMADWKYDTKDKSYVLTKSGNVLVKMEKNFAETPVYMDSVFTIEGKKIGYMVYNFFATGKSNKTHEYDEILMETLSKMTEAPRKIDEMVLDLRYNGGGAVSTAIALASALVTDRSIEKVFAKSEYNSIVDKALKAEDGADYNKEFFVDKIKDGRKIIDVPALNLPRLYVLVSGNSASASELVINGLKPYMDVILIGETTYGKNVGSISIYEDDDPKNKWGMQPIIVKYYNSDGKSDFTDGFKPDYEVDELENLRLVEFGNTEDPLLSVAINQITGSGPKTRSLSMPKTKTQSEMIEVKGGNSLFIDKSRFEMYDDVRGKKIKELMQK